MQAVLSYLRVNERRFIAELSAYVRFPSVSAQAQHRGDLQRCAEWLTEHCRAFGLDAKLHATKGNPILLARTPRARGSRKKHFVVYGHYDVQPPEPFELWKSPPFEPLTTTLPEAWNVMKPPAAEPETFTRTFSL